MAGLLSVLALAFVAAVPGDLNGDGAVDAADLAAFVDAWRTFHRGGALPSECDLDGDATIGCSDALLLLEALLSHPATVHSRCAAAAAARKVLTSQGDGEVSEDGGFRANLAAANAPEVIVAVGKDNGPTGLAIACATGTQPGLWGSQALDARTTALALVLSSPILASVSEEDLRDHVVPHVAASQEYKTLIRAVRGQMEAGVAVPDYPLAIFEAANRIAAAALNSASTSAARSCFFPARRPEIEDAPGPVVHLINTTCCYYFFEVWDDRGRVVGATQLPACNGLLKLAIWPPSFGVQRTVTLIELPARTGIFYVSFYKGLDGMYPSTLLVTVPEHPASLAAVCNACKALVLALKIFVRALHIPVRLSVHTLLRLPAAELWKLAEAFNSGDLVKVLVTVFEVALANAEAIAYWIWQETGTKLATDYVREVCAIGAKLAAALAILDIANEVLPFVYDTFTSPWWLGVKVRQSASLVARVRLVEETFERPVIRSVAAEPQEVPPGGLITLRCIAEPTRDGEPLHYTWLLPDGTTMSGPTVAWQAPRQSGIYDIVCRVRNCWGICSANDGHVQVAVTETTVIIQGAR